MSRARRVEERLGKAARWLLITGLLFSLSTFQGAWMGCLCQTPDESEACECAHGCDPSGGMHDETVDKSEHHHSVTQFSVTGSESSGTHSLACCQHSQQSERPIVTFSQQLIEEESSPVAAVAVMSPTIEAAIRTHDPPRERPLYVTHSCLLI
jgi:hypothetical protein